MTEPNVASVPVTTFAKRQRRISPNNNLNSKAIKEASVVTELNFEDITTHDESEMMKTPNGAPRQATSKEVMDPIPTISPSMKLYFDLVDKEQLLVEEADDEDDAN